MMSAAVEKLILHLFEAGMVKFGQFTLKSGAKSAFYFDLRPIISRPLLLRQLAGVFVEQMEGLVCDRIAGIPFTGLPLAVAVALEGNYPMVFCRERSKAYGTGRLVEGDHNVGDRVLLLDDTITDGASKLDSIERFRSVQLVVKDVLVFLDRRQGGEATLRRHAVNLVSVCDVYDLLRVLFAAGKIVQEQYEEVLSYFGVGCPEGRQQQKG